MRLTRAFLATLALSGAAACSDTTDPTPAGTTTITLAPCSLFQLGWFAYQNQGGPWTRLTPDANGGLSFNATEKVSLAMSFSLFGTSFTQVINASATELQGASGVECDELSGDKFMNGTVAGITGDQYVRITAATSVDDASLADPSWALEDLPATTVDIVATRYPTAFSQPANRVLVRRGIIPLNGTVSTLDFNHPIESGAPEANTVTLAGASTASTFYVESSVITGNGTEHELSELSSQSAATFNYLSLPAALRFAADQHVISATATGLEGSWSVQHYYKTPSAKALTFGPMVSAPTITTVASSPTVRPRAQIAAQQQYPTAAEIMFSESTGEFSSRVISVVTTAGFTGGTPETWDIVIPDMSAASFPASASLQTTNYNWTASAYSAPSGSLIMGGVLPEGATIASATRSNDVNFSGASRVARRPNLLTRPGVGLR